MVGQRRRQRRLARLSSSSASSASTSSCIGLARCAVLPLLLLPLLQQAAAFSLPAPVGRLLRLGRGAPVVVAQQRVTTTALAAAVGEDGGGGGGYPISPNYGVRVVFVCGGGAGKHRAK